MTATHLDHERPRQERVKCVVVGDSGVGKTRLICARARNAKFTLKELCGPHVPTVWAIDQYHQHQDVLENSWEAVDDVNVTLRLWDTFGCHDKDRKFAFGRSDVVALCFSVTNPASLRHCVDKWWPEIRRFCPKTPIILIGCRNDMRHLYKDAAYFQIVPDERRRVKESDIILPEKGRNVASQIGAVAYYETSVLSGFGIRSAFTNAVRAALIHRRQTRFWASHLKNVRGPEFQSPYLIPPPPIPEHITSVSTFEDDLCNMVDNPQFPDIEFSCGDGVKVFAHRILLAAASTELHNLCRFSGDDVTASQEGNVCFTEQLLLPSDDGRESQRLQLTLRPEFHSRTLQQLMHFLYCGTLDMTPETVQPLQVLSQHLGVKPLTKIITSRLSGDEDEGNAATGCQFVLERNQRLASLALEASSVFADVTFLVDDGKLAAYRGLISKRSTFMSAMLCGNFDESRKDEIRIPDVDLLTLKHCLSFLYTDVCPDTKDVYEAMDVLAAADRFCVPRLMDLIQEHIITTYLTLAADDADSRAECRVAQKALELLELAEAFHGAKLYNWCLNFISTHYVLIYRLYLQQLRSLCPRHQALLSQQRHPPVWYISEYDLYEQSLERRRQEMLELLRKRRSRFSRALRPSVENFAGSGVRLPHVTNSHSRALSEPPSRRDAGAMTRWRVLLCSR